MFRPETLGVREENPFGNGVHSWNARRFVVQHGGSSELATKFQTYCQIYDGVLPPMAADPAPANGSVWGTHVQDRIESLFEICDLQNEEIVAQLAKILA